MATAASIKLAAIARLGSEVPQSTDSDTDEIAVIDRIYDVIVDEWLCLHAWSFSTHTTVLEVTDTVPEAPWLYQFDLPAECINVREVLRRGVPAQFELRDAHLLAMSNEDLTLVHNWRASEERWPGDFAAALTEELLGQLLEAFEEPDRGATRRANAERMRRRANVRDKRQRPGRRGDNPRMLRVWRNRNPGRV